MVNLRQMRGLFQILSMSYCREDNTTFHSFFGPVSVGPSFSFYFRDLWCNAGYSIDEVTFVHSSKARAVKVFACIRPMCGGDPIETVVDITHELSQDPVAAELLNVDVPTAISFIDKCLFQLTQGANYAFNAMFSRPRFIALADAVSRAKQVGISMCSKRALNQKIGEHSDSFF